MTLSDAKGAPAPVPAGRQGTIDVLLADGDERFREIVRRRLGGRVRLVAEAASGAEAIERARVCRPHVVLMDLGLEDPDTFGVTRRIKADDPRTKVVLMTAHDEEAYLDATGKSGADALLPKRRVRDEVLDIVIAAATGEAPARAAWGAWASTR